MMNHEQIRTSPVNFDDQPRLSRNNSPSSLDVDRSSQESLNLDDFDQDTAVKYFK